MPSSHLRTPLTPVLPTQLRTSPCSGGPPAFPLSPNLAHLPPTCRGSPGRRPEGHTRPACGSSARLLVPTSHGCADPLSAHGTPRAESQGGRCLCSARPHRPGAPRLSCLGVQTQARAGKETGAPGCGETAGRTRPCSPRPRPQGAGSGGQSPAHTAVGG